MEKGQGKPIEVDQTIPSLVGIGEAARVLNVHPNTLRRWVVKGWIGAWRIGPRGDRRFSEPEVRALALGPNQKKPGSLVENRKS